MLGFWLKSGTEKLVGCIILARQNEFSLIPANSTFQGTWPVVHPASHVRTAWLKGPKQTGMVSRVGGRGSVDWDLDLFRCKPSKLQTLAASSSLPGQPPKLPKLLLLPLLGAGVPAVGVDPRSCSGLPSSQQVPSGTSGRAALSSTKSGAFRCELCIFWSSETVHPAHPVGAKGTRLSTPCEFTALRFILPNFRSSDSPSCARCTKKHRRIVPLLGHFDLPSTEKA